jgi:hypothetical protein
MDDLAGAGVRIEQARVEGLYVGYEHLLSNRVPGKPVWLWPDDKSPQLLAAFRIEDDEMPVTARGGEYELTCIRRAQHSTALGTARQRALQLETRTVNDIDGAVAGVRDKHPAGGWMDIGVVETTT